MKLITLYRPVGQKELNLIIQSGYKKFPPRLEWQPIFYPVLNQSYAEQIASEWNTKDEFSGYAGYVTAFDLPEEYLSKFPVQNVGGEIHNELWIPAEELEEFNANIIGGIRIIKSFFGEKYNAMKYSSDWLKNKMNDEIKLDYLFFWGHRQKQKDSIDKSCFSQWFASPFKVDNILYLTSEHWMMAKKAALFNDNEILKEILSTEKPAVAKELGRKIKNFDAAVWKAHCYTIVVEGNLHKFSQNQNIKTFLLQTGNKIIVEASPVDTVWGIGLSHENPDVQNPSKWKGSNLLG